MMEKCTAGVLTWMVLTIGEIGEEVHMNKTTNISEKDFLGSCTDMHQNSGNQQEKENIGGTAIIRTRGQKRVQTLRSQTSKNKIPT